MRLALAILMLIVIGCAPYPPSMAESVTALKDACLESCMGQTEVEVHLEENALVYTTTEAICIRNDNRLSCGTCSCSDAWLSEAQVLVNGEERTVHCTFHRNESIINAACA